MKCISDQHPGVRSRIWVATLAWSVVACRFAAGQDAAANVPAATKPSKPATEKPADKAKKKQEESKSAEAKQIESTIGILQGRLKQVADLKGFSDDVKKRIAADYQRAIDLYKVGIDWSKRADHFERDRNAASAKIEQLKRENARPREAVNLGDTTKLKLAELEKQAVETDAKVEDAKKLVARWENEPNRRKDRRAEIAKQQTVIRGRLEQVNKEIEAKAQVKEANDDLRAQRSALAGQRYALEQELHSYAKELLYYDATSELPTLEQESAIDDLSHATKASKALKALAAARRTAEAERAAERARAEAADLNDADVDPKLRSLAQENAAFAKTRADMVIDIGKVDAEAQRIDLQLKQIRDGFEYVEKKIKLGGVSMVNGVYLRQLKEKLPDVRKPRRSLRKLQQTIADVQLKVIELQEEREELLDVEDDVDKMTGEAEVMPEDKLDYESEVKKLLKTRRDYVNALLVDYEKYVDKLSDFDTKNRQLIDQTEKANAYIRDKVLWVRSSQALSEADTRDALATAGWLGNPDNWQGVGQLLKIDALAHPYVLGAAGLIFFALNVFRGWMRRRLRALGELAAKPTTADFAPTWRSVVLTSLIAGLVPLPLWFLAWRLTVGLDAVDSDFASALADGFVAVALPFMALEFFRQVCRDKGLAEAHFGWQPRVLHLVRVALRGMLLVGMPIIFFVEVIEAANRNAYTNSLGRAILIVGQLVLAYFGHRLFHWKRGVINQLVADSPGSLLDRLRVPIYLLSVGIPLLLGFTAALGYYYTTRHITLRVKSSIWIGLCTLVAYGLMLRWLLVARRRMAFEQARRRREELSEAKSADGNMVSAGDAQGDLGLDLSTINSQTRRLLRSFMGLSICVAMWATWADVVPADRWLDKVTFWNANLKVNETIANADGTSEQRTVEKVVPITLSNLLMCAIVVGMTLAASRNVPGLLEISVLQRLPLDAGGRYAITTVCRYLITIVGMAVAFGTIGIGWSSVQWLAAAMTVGLGFGLQEIFANFISGLILLLERPIRVGDTVTVGDVTGVVTRIRIRATTITDADRKELIVPNKEFITGKLMNWTLSDPTLRVMVKVSVAYGTQADRVLRILEEVGRSNAMVLREPPPQACFDGFGESTLSFSLRAFVPSIETMSKVKHDLHVNVERALRDANIEPTSSHYDVYLRSSPKDGEGDANVAGIINAATRRQSA